MTTTATYARGRLDQSSWLIDSTALIEDKTGAVVEYNMVAIHLTREVTVEDAGLGHAYDSYGFKNLQSRVRELLGIDFQPVNFAEYGWTEEGFRYEGWFTNRMPPVRLWSGFDIDLPLPILGSPPKDWTSLKDLVSGSPAVIGVAGLLMQDRPVWAILTGVTGIFVWGSKPAATEIRDYYTKRLKKKLKELDK